MKAIAFFWMLVPLIPCAHADCKYDRLVQLGAMSKEVGRKYCLAEALKIQAEVQFKEASDKCHAKYNKGAATLELGKCLTDARTKLNSGIESYQKVLGEAQSASLPKKAVKKDGPFEERDENTLTRGTYVNGKLDGKYEEITYFDKEAEPQYAGKEDERRVTIYKNGRREGKFERYSEGNIVEKGQFKNNEEVGMWEYQYGDRWYKRIYCGNDVVIDTQEGGGATCDNPSVVY